LEFSWKAGAGGAINDLGKGKRLVLFRVGANGATISFKKVGAGNGMGLVEGEGSCD